jgi:3-dehydroquinate dehydratase-2
VASVLVLHGPNLNLLGEREPGIYGSVSLAEIDRSLVSQGEAAGVRVETFQSNHEGELIDRIQAARGSFDLLIINPGALTHYSYALQDAIRAVRLPAIEVHLSNIYAREEWRHQSVVAPAALGQIAGFGQLSYTLAMTAAISILEKR